VSVLRVFPGRRKIAPWKRSGAGASRGLQNRCRAPVPVSGVGSIPMRFRQDSRSLKDPLPWHNHDAVPANAVAWQLGESTEIPDQIGAQALLLQVMTGAIEIESLTAERIKGRAVSGDKATVFWLEQWNDPKVRDSHCTDTMILLDGKWRTSMSSCGGD